MSNLFENKESGSSAEKKRKYIQRWLKDNSYNKYTSVNNSFNEETSLCLTEINKEHETLNIIPVTPSLGQKDSVSCTYPISPVLSGKRSASSKIQNHRKIQKRVEISHKLSTKMTEEITCFHVKKETMGKLKIQANSEQYNEQRLHFKTNYDVAALKSKIISNDNTKIKIYNDTKCTNSLSKNINGRDFSNTFSIVGASNSQFIESASSENDSIEDTEINSDTDKTESDLIEEISTQAVSEASFKRDQNLSENIANSLSISSESVNITHVSNSAKIKSSENQKYIEKFNSIDLIDSVSTLESKKDFINTSYLLQYTMEKHKKKKHPKKGTLSDILHLKIKKERSNLNLLRHQLYKTSPNTPMKPFILLQIVQYLPMINENQLLKCVLIEDSMDLLNGLLKKQVHRFITVMNVPEISCLINTTQKPILKVYEPWTILDPDQLFLHVTQFVAIPSTVTEEIDIIDDSVNTQNYKVTQEFHCPCIYEKMLSNNCKSKLQDNVYNIIKEIFYYK